MKSILSKNCCNNKNPAPYPKLMRSHDSGVIILFTCKGEGTVVHGISERGYTIGKYHGNWGALGVPFDEIFYDYDGDICITNGE